jgi:hypothetical protein
MNEFSADNETAEDSTKAAGNEAADNETQDTTELTSQNISTQFTATDNTQDGASDKGGGGQGMNSDFGQGGGFGGGNGMGGTPPTGDNNGGGQQGEMPDFSPNGSDGGTATDDKSSVTGQNDGAAQGTAPDSSQSNDSSTTPDENKTADENSSSDNSGTNAPEIPSGDNMNDRGGGMGGGDMGGGMSGSDDVSLIYTDDEYSSYENIFNNAKTDITDEDKDRLIASLKKLNANEDISDVVNVEEVIRYFVVHNFVCNFDSYTGSMIHNYYLYEKDGQMSMIPWDYNLAFGGFMGSQDASSLINYPIDTPVSSGTVDSRPMLAWIFASDEYTELYHSLFSEFIEEYFDNDYIPNLIKETEEMISSYVEKDPTKFCTYEEFESGVDALWSFCVLRAESISGQLDGTIPSTSDGQSADSSTLISAGDLNISDMGTMNVGNNDNNMQMPENGFATMSMGDGSQTADGSSNQNVPDKPSGTQSDSDSADNSDSFSLAGNFDGSPPDLPDSDNSGQQPTSDGSSITTDSQDSDGAASQNSDGTDSQKQDDKKNFGNENFDKNDGEGKQSSNSLSKETIILSVASLAVLIVGIVIAFVYKKKN